MVWWYSDPSHPLVATISLLVATTLRGSGELIHEAVDVSLDEIYRAQLSGFLSAIDGQADELTTPSEGLHSAACSDAIIRSLKAGKRVQVQASRP